MVVTGGTGGWTLVSDPGPSESVRNDFRVHLSGPESRPFTVEGKDPSVRQAPEATYPVGSVEVRVVVSDFVSVGWFSMAPTSRWKDPGAMRREQLLQWYPIQYERSTPPPS